MEDYRGEAMLDDTMLVKAAYGNITDWTVKLTKGLVNELSLIHI